MSCSSKCQSTRRSCQKYVENVWGNDMQNRKNSVSSVCQCTSWGDTADSSLVLSRCRVSALSRQGSERETRNHNCLDVTVKLFFSSFTFMKTNAQFKMWSWCKLWDKEEYKVCQRQGQCGDIIKHELNKIKWNRWVSITVPKSSKTWVKDKQRTFTVRLA